jgi:hypothetical protein
MCSPCFIAKAQKRKRISPQDIERVKKAYLDVKAETYGLLPRGVLLEIIETGYDRLVKGEGKFDEEVEYLVNEIERLAGLSICKEMLKVLDAMDGVFGEQREEIRRKLKKLASL